MGDSSEFVHLHVHSHFSLLTGLPKIKDLVRHARECGFSHLALTDYGSMYGAIQFYEACKAEGIQPIIGVEVFVAPHSRHDKRHGIDNKVSHLVLLAETLVGYRNLMALTSLGHLEGFYYRPRVDFELLERHREGVIALSGCMGGAISQLVLQGAREEQVDALIARHVAVFGADNFFLELQDHPEKEGQVQVNNALIAAGERLGVPLVVTRDVHYLHPADAEAQDVLTCIKDGKQVDQPGRFSLRHVDRSMNTADDIAQRFSHVPQAISNTMAIARRCAVEIPLGSWHFPAYDIPEGRTFEDVLVEKVYAGLQEKYTPEKAVEYRARADYELKIINDRGYAPYFLVVADFLQWAKDNKVVTTTRGSAAGSIVSYCINITTIDPMHYKLPFERFLNPFRPTPPDVDADIADYRRGEVIEYVTQKYGHDKVAQICTFGTMAARASLRDVGRALGHSYAWVDRIAKLVPQGSQGFPMTLARALEMTPELKEAYEKDAEIKRLFDLAKKIEGCARHVSVHAAGVVISPTPLVDFTPVQREPGGDKIITQYEMKSVENAGVLKMDFLGLRNLSILEEALRYIKKIHGVDIDLERVPLDDRTTYEMLGRGQTQGVFQLSSTGMTKYLRELQPERIEDIMAMVALYRPGPMEMIPEYIARKRDPARVTYLDPRLKDVLDMSYGIITYQDDVLLTAIHIAGYDWGEADKLRKAMGKKIPAEMAKQKEKFIEGAIAGGMKRATVMELWKQIEPFAAYGFNKCLVGDTRVVDPVAGRAVTIRELYERSQSFHVLGLDNSRRLVPYAASQVYANGVKRVYRVRTRSGRSVGATANHPVLCYDGWVDVSHVRVGDRIAVPRVLPYEGVRPLPTGYAKVLGYLISEGNLCHPHGVYFYSSREDEIEDFCRAVVGCFHNVACTIDRSKPAMSVYVRKTRPSEPNSLMAWIVSLGLHGCRAVDKFVPRPIFEAPNRQVSEFIGALWQGDGCVSFSSGGQIFYATSSERLARDVQHLLLRLGVVSTIHTKQFAYRGSRRVGYTVHISRYGNIERFHAHVGGFLLGAKKKKLDELVRSHVLYGQSPRGVARGTKDTIPPAVMQRIRSTMSVRGISIRDVAARIGVAPRLFSVDSRRIGYQRETIAHIAQEVGCAEAYYDAVSDVYWDEVVSIEDEGLQPTYDLTVPGGHNFVADDVIVHNSHACSYGMVAYQTAYLKANYPSEFMAAVLSCESHDLEKVAVNVQECEAMGIEVLPPDVNESFASFGVVADSDAPRIRFGLGAVKNVGAHITEVIIEERKRAGRYAGLEDFLIRVRDKDLNKKSLESLIKCGAMDCFGDRATLLANLERILQFSKAVGEMVHSQQSSLFGGGFAGMRVRLDAAPPVSDEEKLAWEKELLGLYVSSHPARALDAVHCEGVVHVRDVLGDVDGGDPWVCIAGVVNSCKRVITKKGEAMGFFSLEDSTGEIEVVVFPSVYEKFRALCEEGKMVAALGKRSVRDDEHKVLAERMCEVSPATMRERVARLIEPPQDEVQVEGAVPVASEFRYPSRSMVIRFFGDDIQKMEDVRAVLGERPGAYRVFVKIPYRRGAQIIESGLTTCIDPTITRRIEELVGEGSVEIIE